MKPGMKNQREDKKKTKTINSKMNNPLRQMNKHTAKDKRITQSNLIIEN